MGGWCCFPGGWHLPASPLKSSTHHRCQFSSDLVTSLGRQKKFETIEKLNQERELAQAHKSLIRGAQPVDL